MPGLTSMPDASTVARIVIAATGESPSELRIIGSGATAVGWRADTDGGSYCVLIATPRESYIERYPGADAQFEARFAVMSALHERDPRCPEPIATNLSPNVPESLRASRWIVTTLAPGAALDGPIPPEVARELGEVVAALHALPTRGYGVLLDTQEEIAGAGEAPGAGFTSRWGREIWPYSGRPLTTHPIVQAAPHLVLQVAAIREQLLAYADVPRQVVSHCDLHGRNVFVEGGHLSALIDFGDCAILPAAQEIAELAFREGWTTAEAFLEGYARNRVLRDLRRAEAQQVSIVVGLQRVERYLTRDPDPDAVTRAIAFLEETVPMAVRRMDA